MATHYVLNEDKYGSTNSNCSRTLLKENSVFFTDCYSLIRSSVWTNSSQARVHHLFATHIRYNRTKTEHVARQAFRTAALILTSDHAMNIDVIT